MLAPGGQLAVQMPSNFDHSSHESAREIAAEEPFRSALDGYAGVKSVLPPERYAELLDGLGVEAQQVRLQVYGHHLESAESVIEWVRGTLLTDYQRRLGDPLFEDSWPAIENGYSPCSAPAPSSSRSSASCSGREPSASRRYAG